MISFNDIGCNRTSGTLKLLDDSVSLLPWEALCDSVDGKRQFVRFLPNGKFFKVSCHYSLFAIRYSLIQPRWASGTYFLRVGPV